MLLITGGAGFIGAHFADQWLDCTDEPLVNVDKLTYAGNLQNLARVLQDDRHHFVKADIADSHLIAQVLATYRPRAIINFAAESHVDRSIHDPDVFIQTNVLGTLHLLKAALNYWSQLPEEQKRAFRFIQISTDEVYGSLAPGQPAVSEASPYAPNSPYAASKASADHLVRSFFQTYGLPAITTISSNNYGPRQFPEKLIPLVIHHALSDAPIPVYGDGENIRDWLYVEDHCAAIAAVLARGRAGEVYNIGGGNERRNIAIVNLICKHLDGLRPRPDGRSYREQITFVTDRAGHDRRYALSASRMRQEIGWQPQHGFDDGLGTTIRWYLDNGAWVENVTTGAYRDWVALHYAERASSA